MVHRVGFVAVPFTVARRSPGQGLHACGVCVLSAVCEP